MIRYLRTACLALAASSLMAVSACDSTPDEEDVIPAGGPGYNDRPEIINEVVGPGAPDEMPGTGAPGNEWNSVAEPAP